MRNIVIPIGSLTKNIDALKKNEKEEEMERKEDVEICSKRKSNEEKIKTNRDLTRSESKPPRPNRELLMQFSSISVVDGQLFQVR